MYERIEYRLSEFGPQALSMILWSSATLGQPIPPRLIRAVYASTCHATSSSFLAAASPPGVAGAAAAAAAAAQATTRVLAGFPPQSLANLIWAVSVGECASTV